MVRVKQRYASGIMSKSARLKKIRHHFRNSTDAATLQRTFEKGTECFPKSKFSNQRFLCLKCANVI